ncbi:MAG: CsbD family protein [Solirubrobacteraceae bacterium]|nr:CsbD family protein [Patulibacter sp.]
MAGEGDKISGTVKEKVGAVTGNDRLEGEGKGQKNAGKVEDAVKGAADKAKGALDAVADKLGGHHEGDKH